MNLESDLSKTVKNYANEAVGHAKRLGIDLDFSNESIHQVENILDILHKAAQETTPAEEQYGVFANMYGCYVGETFIKNLGRGEWTTSQDGLTAGATVVNVDGAQILFPAKVYRRLKNGAEDNVEHLYLHSFK